MNAMTTELATPASLDTLTVGILPGLTEEQYDAIPAVRSTHLKTLAMRTPAHLREQIQSPQQKPCFDLGNATHCSILQPELFDSLYAVAGRCCATTGKGARCTNGGKFELDGEWFCGVHTPDIVQAFSRTIISADDYRKCIDMRDSAWAHPRVRRLLEARGDREVAAVWRDEPTGLYGKFRADVFAAAGVLGDLKTTQDASRDGFSRAIAKYGYHVSAAWYLEGAAKVDRSVEAFTFIPVETEPPYAVNILQLEDEAASKGWDAARRAMDLYAECEASGKWPAFGHEIGSVGLPGWVK